jgi:hypothetical protein
MLPQLERGHIGTIMRIRWQNIRLERLLSAAARSHLEDVRGDPGRPPTRAEIANLTRTRRGPEEKSRKIAAAFLSGFAASAFAALADNRL